MVRAALIALTVSMGLSVFAQQQAPANHDLGFKDTPMLPGLPWHVHDPDRPHPPVVTPAPADRPAAPPSDAIVLFDGRDLSKWQSQASTISRGGRAGDPEWKLTDGVIQVVPG